MAGRLTVIGASMLLTTYFGRSSEPPTSFYLALIKDIAPTPYMSGEELDEPENTDYSRVQILNDLDTWANESQPQEIYNVPEVAFTTAVSDWGLVRYWALCDDVKGGNNLIVGDLENPIDIAIDDQVMFVQGDLSVSLGPFFLSEEDE